MHYDTSALFSEMNDKSNIAESKTSKSSKL